MATCDQCGRDESMPYTCRYCGGTFCPDHRLPENHVCPGLENWNDPKGVFDSGFDDTARHSGGRSGGVLSQVPGVGGDSSVTRRGGVLGYFRGNASYAFLALMWVTFLLQWLTILLDGRGPNSLHTTLFVLSSQHPEYVWTWITAIFSHGGFGHIAVNSIVLYFFGPVVERRIGTKAFVALFLVGGAVAGLAQVGTAIAVGEVSGVLGASGAIMAVMGVLTVLNPQLRVYLYFILPLPLWLITIGFAAYSVFVALGGGIGAGNVAHLAHLAGLVVGLAYGEWLRRHGASGPSQLQFGTGRGPGGPRRRF